MASGKPTIKRNAALADCPHDWEQKGNGHVCKLCRTDTRLPLPHDLGRPIDVINQKYWPDNVRK